MHWSDEAEIIEFLSAHNYDVRLSHNARWIDQKCTPDVLNIIADCIFNFIADDRNITFSSADIWHDEYAVNNISELFQKPDPNSELAISEYNKFFQQPMELLAYSGVLNKTKIGNRNIYSVNNLDALTFIAIRERNALFFLRHYIEKVLIDSDIFGAFSAFFMSQNQRTFFNVKDSFTDFTIENTRINTAVECHRIFTKVLNPLAFFRNSRGTNRGRLSENPIAYEVLKYNRVNFRDVYANKPRGITRREFAIQNHLAADDAFVRYNSQRAKRFLRLFNDSFRGGSSELLDDIHNDEIATHVHHIFPESEFPEICEYFENLICLTPTQHLNYAHPLANTQRIVEAYQQLCLITKADRIRENIEDHEIETIYDFGYFKYVLFTGLENEIFTQIEDMDFGSIIREINSSYASRD
jgi:hypothetical protein